MKLELVQYDDEPKRRPKKPIDHFNKCPACGDKDLIPLDPDVLCSKCDWNSLVWHVSAGGMDDMKSAMREFEAGTRRGKIKVVKPEAESRPELEVAAEQFFEKLGEKIP